MTNRLICPLGHCWNGARSSLCPECGAAGRVELDPTALDDGTPVRGVALTQAAGSATDSALPLPVMAGCEVLGEIARGGMGVVYRAHDTALGRDLALKVLRPEYAALPDLRQRFLEEAQVAGQLQHPGIVPVYHVGVAADGRPCFTMKLVQGRTLGELLRERPGPAEDQARFLLIFEQVCQALAYAHDHGVLHRDLKPDNIMVGPFGEVLVMDWGLAKVLEWARRGVRTVRTVAGSSPSEIGSILGTPAYMAPEQARGETDRLDERADVFGLGAILCEILTGSPPYVGQASWEVAIQAAQGDLTPALARLEACGADADLIRLARECLAVDRDARPRDAGLVAVRVIDYRAAVMERAAQARLQEEVVRREPAPAAGPRHGGRRRLLSAAALAVSLGLAVLLGFGWRREVLHQRDDQAARRDEKVRQDEARNRAIDEDLRRVADRRREGRLAEAWAALARAEGRRQGEAEEPRALTAARAALEADQRDREMLDRLEAIRRQTPGGGARGEQADQVYRKAFASYGLDVEDRPAAAAQGLQVSALRGPLVAALDAWARAAPPERAEHLRAVASLADADPWQRQVRAADAKTESLELLRLAEKPEATSPTGALLLVDALDRVGESGRALTLLRTAQRRHPGDLPLAWTLGARLLDARPVPALEAVRCLTLAVGLSPDSAAVRVDQGEALVVAGLLDEAIEAYQAALRLEPKKTRAQWGLGEALLKQGRCAEARDVLRALPVVDPGILQEVERLADLEERLPAYRTGKLEPIDGQQAADLGRLCRLKGLPAAAAGFYASAFAADPTLAARHRPAALVAAARAGSGQGGDARPEDERVRLRRLARSWLRDEATACEALVASGKEEARAAAVSRLRALLDEADLAVVRNPDALAALSGEERKAWERLWQDIGSLWQQAVTRK